MIQNPQQPSFNAVKIDIIEPKNQFGSNFQSPLNQNPYNQVPAICYPQPQVYNYPNAPMYNYTPNGLYNIPTGNIYGAQNPQQMNQFTQPWVQQNPYFQQVNQLPQTVPNYINQAQIPQQIYQYPLPIPVTTPSMQGSVPMPQPMVNPSLLNGQPPMPQVVQTQPQIEQTQIPQPPAPQAQVPPMPIPQQAQIPQPPVPQAQVPPIPTPQTSSVQPAPVNEKQTPEQPAQPAPVNEAEKIQKDFEESKNNMKSTDPDKRIAGIISLAQLAQQNPQLAPGLLDPDVYKILVGDETQKGIITKETSAKKPEETQEEAAARQKEEAAKMIGMFTLALLQKSIRTELKKDASQQQSLSLVDLPGIPQIITNVKSDPSPEVRAAAIQAMKYVKEPEDQNIVDTVFKIALEQDESPRVKASAMDGLISIATPDKIKDYVKMFKNESKAAAKASKKEQDPQVHEELDNLVQAAEQGLDILQDPNKLAAFQNPPAEQPVQQPAQQPAQQ